MDSIRNLKILQNNIINYLIVDEFKFPYSLFYFINRIKYDDAVVIL